MVLAKHGLLLALAAAVRLITEHALAWRRALPADESHVGSDGVIPLTQRWV